MLSSSPAPPTASGAPAAGCLDLQPTGRWPVHTRVGPLPATPGTARRGSCFALPEPCPAYGKRRSCRRLSCSASGGPRADSLKSWTLARHSGHGQEGSCFQCLALPEPRSALARRAALLLLAVLIRIWLAACRSTQEWAPCQPLRARPGGELLHSPQAPPRPRGAGLLQQAVSIRSRRAASLSTQGSCFALPEPRPADGKRHSCRRLS